MKGASKVQGARGETHSCLSRPPTIPPISAPVDIVLFCVKLWDVESAGQQVGIFMHMIFGEFYGKRSKRGEDFLALCVKAGFDATKAPDR